MEATQSNSRYLNIKINKSLVTNLIALITLIAGIYSPIYRQEIFNIGIFALSGAITNWLAIYMLFEKVPGLYGSGVIPSRFEEFKTGIKDLVMGQFFSNQNLEKFFKNNVQNFEDSINLDPIINSIDYHNIFNKLIAVITSSPMGGMLAMFGGEGVLRPFEAPFIEKIKESLDEMKSSEQFKKALQETVSKSPITEEIAEKIEEIVDKRLNELTPQLVKEIIQEMIRKHLGWLVVWGGVFGGLIGLASTLFT